MCEPTAFWAFRDLIRVSDRTFPPSNNIKLCSRRSTPLSVGWVLLGLGLESPHLLRVEQREIITFFFEQNNIHLPLKCIPLLTTLHLED